MKDINRCGIWRNENKQSEDDRKPHFKGKFIDSNGDLQHIALWKTSKESLEENPKRPLLHCQIQSDSEVQKFKQKEYEKGMKGVRQVLSNEMPSPPPPPPALEPVIDYEDDIPF
tara:strand:- start:1249 stop:1590 length:342 start_codon:yes stop_codon:yes gene_type:complete